VIVKSKRIFRGDVINASVRPEGTCSEPRKANGLTCIAEKLVEIIYEGSVVNTIA
jgi:hypothetical protein